MRAKILVKPKIKPKARPGSIRLQNFDPAEAKRDAMAMFSGDLNTYERAPGNKWRKMVRKSGP